MNASFVKILDKAQNSGFLVSLCGVSMGTYPT